MQIKVWVTKFDEDKVIVMEVMDKATTMETLIDLAQLLYCFYYKVNFNC